MKNLCLWLSLWFLTILPSSKAFSELVASYELRYVYAEFRPSNENPERWFVSMLHGMVFEHLAFEDRFQHPNLGGPSYYLKEIDQNLNPLKEAKKRRDLFSIWDSIVCRSGNLELHTNFHGIHSLRVSNLGSCEKEWND